jgi:hypothetical protein
MRRRIVALALTLALVRIASGQDLSLQSLSPELKGTQFDARFAIGFNYDMLRSPLDVSFDYPKGYVGLDIPFRQSFNLLKVANGQGAGMDKFFGDTTLFRSGKEYQPTARASARQNPNTTFRVDVPMLGGVGSFSNIQNVGLSYQNTLGLPSARASMSMADQGVSMLFRAAIYVPVDLSASWETMTFGYAYKVNKNLVVGLNLHRHVFMLDMRAKIDVDMLGYAEVDQQVLKTRIPIDYTVGGEANAHYDAEAWSPTLAVKFWRVGATARFGVNARARGGLSASYSLPFFIDPATFAFNLKPENLMDPAFISSLQSGETDTVTHVSTQDMVWKLPDGYTFSFDIVRNKLNLSYTKTRGELQVKLGNIWTVQKRVTSDTAEVAQNDTINLDFRTKVDHVMLLSGNLKHFFFNLGVFTLDFAAARKSHLLGKSLGKVGWPTISGSPLMPVLGVGSALGSKIQLMLELDLLPLAAVKGGVIYYF